MKILVILISIVVQLICFLHIKVIYASDMHSQKLSLSEVVEIALQNNSQIKESKEKVGEVREEKRSARSDFFPKLTASYSYTRLDEIPFMKSPLGSLGLSNLDNYHWDLTAVQPLFTGFALSNKYKMSKNKIKTQKAEKNTVVLEVVKNVKQLYFKLLLSKKFAHVAAESVQNLMLHKKNAEKFYAQGIIPYNDLLRAKVALANVVQNKEKADAGVRIATSGLNILLNRDIDSKIDIKDIHSIPSFSTDFNAIAKDALLNRPELKAARLAVKSIDNGINIVRSSYYPHIALVYRYEQNGENSSATSNDYSNMYNSSITLKADWTLFQWGKTKANVSAYRYKKRSILEKLESIKNGIMFETKNAFLDLNVAKKNINTAKDSLAQAKENWRITNLQYQQQIATSTEVLDARTFLTQAETNYYQALYGYLISIAKLERAMGRDHKESVLNKNTYATS